MKQAEIERQLKKTVKKNESLISALESKADIRDYSHLMRKRKI